MENNTEPPDWAKRISDLLGRHFTTCHKCRRPLRAGQPNWDDWDLKVLLGTWVVGLLCPDCQTPEQRAEHVIRDLIGPKYTLNGLRLIEQPQHEPPYWVSEDPSSDDEGDNQQDPGKTG